MISRWMRPALAAVLGLVPLVAHADDYDEFRIPAHRVMGWDGSLSTFGYRNSSTADTPMGSSADRNRAIQGQGGTRFSWLSDSDPRTTQVFGFVGAGLGETHASNDFTSPSLAQTISHRDRFGIEAWQIFLSHRSYPWAMPLGFSVSVLATGDYQQDWPHQEQAAYDILVSNSTMQRLSGEHWLYRTAVQDAASVGIGRVRDATGVYEAHVLESRLLEARALARPLSADARRQLAEIFYLRSDYESFRERPAKSLWERIESLLREDGAVADSGLDAHAIQRAGEAAVFGGQTSDGLPQSPVLRLRGEHLAAVLSDQHTHLLSRDDVSIFSQVTLSGVPQPPVTVDGHSESSLSSDEVMAGGQAEYHRPLGSHWQLDAFGQALTSVRKEEDGFQVSTNGTASTLISDRLVARAGWIQQRSTSRDVSSDVILDDSWRWRFFVSASYYLEDHLEVQGAISDDQLHQRIPLIVFGSPLPSTVYQRNQQFSLALTYRFMGSFAAPGLMAAENLAGPR